MSVMHEDAVLSTREDFKKNKWSWAPTRQRGGVDNLDKVIATCSCRCMTARWPLLIFFSIIESAYNTFIIWSEVNKNWDSRKLSQRRIFLENEVKPHIERELRFPRKSTAVVEIVFFLNVMYTKSVLIYSHKITKKIFLSNFRTIYDFVVIGIFFHDHIISNILDV